MPPIAGNVSWQQQLLFLLGGECCIRWDMVPISFVALLKYFAA
jgi:hypothetical protein